jgi:hypothetical protein
MNVETGTKQQQILKHFHNPNHSKVETKLGKNFLELSMNS